MTTLEQFSFLETNESYEERESSQSVENLLRRCDAIGNVY
jgi:hypothetical protein